MASGVGLRRWWGLALLALVMAGCWVRFDQLGTRSLWSDELFTLAVAWYHPLLPEAGHPWYRPISVLQIADGDTFLTVKAGEQSPPLYDLLEKLSVYVLGPSEFAARLPAALAACLLLTWCAAMAWRSRDAWERRVLAWGLLFMVCSPALIAYGREARAYSLGTTLAGMGALLWLQRWRPGPTPWQPPGWGEIALFLAACYTHYSAAVLVLVLLAFDAVMATRTRSRIGWIRLLALGLGFGLWVALSMHTLIFTARGGVSWGQRSRLEYAETALRDVANALHAPWIALFAAMLVGIVAWRRWRGLRLWSPVGRSALVLACIVAMYVVLATVMAAKAGMAHPRYYIFALPLVAVGFALALAQLRGAWQVVGVAAVVGLSLAPGLPGIPLGGAAEDFRGMTTEAARGATEDTVFVYPSVANRNLYRLYLERLLHQDMRSRMVAVTFTEDVPHVCERLAAAAHVAVVAHASARQRIDELYAHCGARWPSRNIHNFSTTFAEHWRRTPH
ncbi:hypothetical protein [Pseudorhodoferax sp.]|uniref:hypothetical protein n=1 Tax=Pseudorhodoferax sp. TaxID=1993553 RepID=UPI002DD67C73|nr:hypothetical protein [Pseudorhodoferax sp.]